MNWMIDSRDRSTSGIYVTKLYSRLGARIGDCLVNVGHRLFQSNSQWVSGAAESFAQYAAILIGDYGVSFSSASIYAEVILLSRSGVFVGQL